MSLDWSIAALVLVLTTCSDAAYVVYMRSVAQDQPLMAATVDTAIHAVTALSILQYTRNPSYLFFALAGGWIGTYVSVLLYKIRRESP